MNSQIDINVHERLEALVARRELSKLQRRKSMRNRLHVKMGAFRGFYEAMTGDPNGTKG